MKIPYKIIWVDDTPTWVDSIRPAIVEYIEQLGYDPEIDTRQDGGGLVKDSRSPDLDLLLIDFNLHGDNGDKLIAEIRAAGTLTEIVFYSQDQAIKDILPSADGIFRCQRDGFEETVKKVVDLTNRKMQDLTVIRGLVIASAIDLEVKLEELMVKVFGATGEILREHVIDEKIFDFGKKCTFVQRVAKDKRKAAVNGTPMQIGLDEVRDLLKNLDKDVVDPRNILAHSRRTVQEGKVVLKGINSRTKSVTIDSAWLSGMRQALKRHLQNLDKFEQLLAENAGP